MNNSKVAYSNAVKNGYGLCHPDGHVIRFYERILKYELNKLSGNLLDFGGGNRIHSEYFKTKGYNVTCVDIIEQSIDEAKRKIGADNAFLIKPN